MTEQLTEDDNDYDVDIDNLTEDEQQNMDEIVRIYISSVVSVRQQSIDLPDTVTILECKNGTKVYLVGTAHFSKESIEDVKKVILGTHPDFVVLELCNSRTGVLVHDDEKIKEEAKNIDLLTHIKTNGVSHGLLQYLMLRMNVYLINTLGMSPGGEFRAAAQEARKQSHCHIVLGDRPIAATLQRAFNALGPWTKLKLCYSLLFSLEPVTPEQVEEMKKSDFLERCIMEMAGEHPELTRIVLEERDMFLAKSIWLTTGMDHSSHSCDEQQPTNSHDNELRQRTVAAHVDSEKADALEESEESHLAPCGDHPHEPPSCCPFWPNPSQLPRVVVAVVGIGHVAGIKKHWDHVEDIDRQELMAVMESPFSWKVFKWSIRVLLLSVLIGTGYGVIRGTYIIGLKLANMWR